MEVVGCRWSFRRAARIAISAGRADAAVAQRICLVRPCSAAVGYSFADSDRTSPILCAAPFCLAYLCGFLWYCGNCYWVRDTMLRYGDMPPMAPTLLLMGFSLVLGLYFGLFGLAVMLVRRATGSTRLALAAAPFCGPRWNWPPRASPAFPGTSSATRRWITRWSTSSRHGPASMASAFCWWP